MTLPAPKQPPQIAIELPADLQPAYANLARIAHAPAEFVIDFARFLPGDKQALVTARVIMSPIGIKMFARALSENITRFESTFGEIQMPSGGPHLADTLFRPYQPPPGDAPKDPPKDPPAKT
jgi:Protein of unknown function (DUF3467)